MNMNNNNDLSHIIKKMNMKNNNNLFPIINKERIIIIIMLYSIK